MKKGEGAGITSLVSLIIEAKAIEIITRDWSQP